VQAATDPIANLALRKHALELRESWQGKVLSRALTLTAGSARPNSPLGAVVLSVLAHNFDQAMPVLLRTCFPGFISIGTPFLVSCARIAKTGDVMADMARRDGRIAKNQVFFRSLRNMESSLRRFADEARLTDTERVEFFDAAKRWVVADYRLDPAMDPADPDAKRLVVH